jgi:hypothetical protein
VVVGNLPCSPLRWFAEGNNGLDGSADEPEPAWRTVGSTYIVCDDDQIIAPAAQEQMAGHATAVWLRRS